MTSITDYIKEREEVMKELCINRGINYLQFINHNKQTIAGILRIVRELSETHEKDKNISVTDNDGHRYQILESKKEEWNEYLELDDEDNWDVPDYAERIDGQDVTNKKFSEILQSIEDDITSNKDSI